MAKDYWKTINRRLMKFWKPGEEIICTSFFLKKNSICELCDKKPITENHVLVNATTKAKLTVGSVCVISYRKVQDKLFPSNQKILYLDKYRNVVDSLNAKHKGTAKLIDIHSHRRIIEKLLEEPDKIDDNTLDEILNLSKPLEILSENEFYEKGDKLFLKALDEWIDRQKKQLDAESAFEKLISAEERRISAEAWGRGKASVEDYFEDDSDNFQPFEDSCLQEDWLDSFDDMGPEDWESKE